VSRTPDGWLAGSPWRDIRLSRQRDDASTLAISAGARVPDGRELEFVLAPGGEMGLLVPVQRDSTLPASGEHILFRPWFSGGQPALFISCADSRLEQPFARFCESVRDRVRDGEEALKAVRLVVEQYRELFRGLNEANSSLLGLAGELLVFEWLLRHDLDALGAWKGPEGGRHDFQFPALHIEVKTGLLTGERAIVVNGLDQLDEPPERELYLAHVRIERGPGTMLDSLVDRIAMLLSADGRSRFGQLVRRIGGDSLATFSFSSSEINLYRVREGFPRLVRSSSPSCVIPLSIDDVTYRLRLDEAEDFRVEEAPVLARAGGEASP